MNAKSFFTKPLVLLLFLGIFSSQGFSQTQSSRQTTTNFYQVREATLKRINDAKANKSINEENRQKDNALKKFMRWENFVAPRVFPSGNFYAPDAVYNEYTNYYTNHQSKLNSTTGVWEAVGPFNDFGDASQSFKAGACRTNCLAQHPTDSNTIYIGTMGGGIWKTVDGGQTWNCYNDNLPSMSFSDIAINPNYPDSVYAASGDAVGNYPVISDPDFHQGHYSAGIFVSGDGGLTWSQTGFTYQQYETVNIYRLIIDAGNTNNLIAGTESGLYRSTDAGATWTQLDTTLVLDIFVNPLDNQKLYAITNSGVQMKRSYDGGATWINSNASILQGGPSFSRIGISAADTSVIFVMRGTGRLFKSVNGGTSFTTIAVPGNTFWHQGDYDKALAISPVSTATVLLGLVDLVKSTNSGVNFAVVDSMYSYTHGIHVDFHSLQFAIGNPYKVYAVNDGGIYVSYDEGQSWTSLNNGMNLTQYYDVSSSFLSTDHLLAGAQDNSTHFYNGTDWTVVTCCDGLDCTFDPTDENIAYASIQSGTVFRSNDGGNTFPVIISPQGFVGAWQTPHLINPLNGSTIYLGGSSVLISHDRGNTFTNYSPLIDTVIFITSMAQSVADTNVFYAASLGKLFVTTDNGVNWIDRSAGLPVSLAGIYDIKARDDDPLIAYAVFSGFSAGNKVYKTIDGGANWINISGTLPNIPVNTIIAQQNTPYNDLYIGTDFGVFFYNDTTGDWLSFNTDLPGVIVVDLDMNYRSGKLFAATAGRGIYKTDPLTFVQPILTDASIASIIAPVIDNYCDSLTTSIVALIKNYGVDTLTSVTINYTIDNGPVNSFIWTGQLASNGSVVDTLASMTFYGGNHNINIYTSNPNGLSDDVPVNDSKQISFDINSTIALFPFAEGFENVFPPADWFKGGTSLWNLGLAGAINASAQSARADFYDIQTGTGYLTSMRIDLTAASASVFLGFAHAYAMYDPTYLDTLVISITNDCTDNWAVVYLKSDTALTTVSNFVTAPFVPAANEWVYSYIDISQYVGQMIKVRFEAHSGFGNDLYVDDINLFNSVTAVEENDKNLVSVFPNPTNGLIYINDPGKILTRVELFNQHGQLILVQNEKAVHTPLRLDTYSQNLYYVKMHTKKGVITKKISKVN